MKAACGMINFGGNIRFTPRHRYTPRDSKAVLTLLNRHAGGTVRVVGSLHSWSDLVVSEDVVVDLRHFNGVAITSHPDGTFSATVGGGCRLKRLLPILDSAGVTLPSLGAVTEQTIAGAIATGTHGSGAASLSHYVEAVQFAAYDPATGRARIVMVSDGAALRAARCNLGCMGIALAVTLRCVPRYFVAETVVRRASIDAVLRDEEEFALQQFFLLPYCWEYFVFQRRPVAGNGGLASRTAPLYRAYNLLNIDIGLHLLIKALISRLGGPQPIRWFYRHIVPRLIRRDWTVVDRSDRVLTLEHELFQHEELEVFVPARRLRAAVDLVRYITARFAGEDPGPTGQAAADLDAIGLRAEVAAQAGSYTHHYPIFFRRIMPDDTLISMTSGADEPFYSISFFTYGAPAARDAFYTFAACLARSLTQLYGARLHWGKHFPLSHAEIAPLYPGLAEFRAICRQMDPNGVFHNGYVRRVLGFADAPQVRALGGREEN